MSQVKKKVMISSTARDLPKHRKELEDACLRQGMFPDMMEHLPTSDAEAISASLKMVDEADIPRTNSMRAMITKTDSVDGRAIPALYY